MSKLDEKPIIVIGGGPGGYQTALEIRKQFPEQKIKLIEKNKLGGACLHVGCIPSKQLHSIKDLNDYPKLLKKNKTILERGVASELKAAGIEVIIAEAKLEGSTLSVNNEELDYSHLVIATGSKPRTLKEFPDALSSDSFFNEENLTEGFASKYCFIGGGYIGIELASMLAKHGIKVRIIEVMDEILPFLDSSIRDKLKQELTKQGIEINTGFKDLSKLEIAEDEKVFVSIGREAIKLAEPSENIHIIGDASNEIALAHYAYAQARQLAYKLAAKEFTIDKNKVPLVIFSHPEIAALGLTADQAKVEVEERIVNWASNGKARVSGADRGMCKWVIEKASGKILGIHMIGPGATDLIAAAVPIINQGLFVQDMQEWIYPHPTLGELLHF